MAKKSKPILTDHTVLGMTLYLKRKSPRARITTVHLLASRFTTHAIAQLESAGAKDSNLYRSSCSRDPGPLEHHLELIARSVQGRS